MYYTRKFAVRAAERALKSAGQSAVLTLGAGHLDALDANWKAVGGFALGAAVLSVATSVASAPIGTDHETPSLVD